VIKEVRKVIIPLIYEAALVMDSYALLVFSDFLSFQPKKILYSWGKERGLYIKRKVR
jgi:hypothetical protein